VRYPGNKLGSRPRPGSGIVVFGYRRIGRTLAAPTGFREKRLIKSPCYAKRTTSVVIPVNFGVSAPASLFCKGTATKTAKNSDAIRCFPSANFAGIEDFCGNPAMAR
jgi:hypothetical protein